MTHNPDRFVIIDGVQVSKARAERLGLIDAKGKPTSPAGPSSTRARSADSTRKGAGGKVKATEGEAPAGDDQEA